MSSMPLAGLRNTLQSQFETPNAKKARRVAYHVVRAAKKFLLGTGGAAWVMGTSMLIMVMPLVFEIDREQQNVDASMGAVMP